MTEKELRELDNHDATIRHGIIMVKNLISVYPDFAREVALLENRCRVLLEAEK